MGFKTLTLSVQRVKVPSRNHPFPKQQPHVDVNLSDLAKMSLLSLSRLAKTWPKKTEFENPYKVHDSMAINSFEKEQQR